MKAVIAIDSFKGSLSSLTAGKAAEEGIRAVYPDADIRVFPIADGGEGTVDAIVYARGGEMQKVLVHGPRGRMTEAIYGKIGNIAVIEMAAASGITLISEAERDPMQTTTYGVGEMIADAIEKGCREFLIGIGGSATNDGGVGMLQALGFAFVDQNGFPISHGAKGLKELAKIETKDVLPALAECRFSVACDVKNPLCGANGCSTVFGPQKGATAETIPQMDAWLAHYAELTRTVNPDADPNREGCGAAGGLGFAFLSYLHAELRSGIEIVMEASKLETAIADADIVITGEGKLDGGSCMGKVPVGVATLAKKHGKPVIAVAGSIADDASHTHAYGIDAFFPIVQAPCSLSDAMNDANAYRNLKRTAEEIFRLWKTLSPT